MVYRILIVDDIKMNRFLIRTMLSSLPETGFLEAANGREAVEMLLSQEVDLVLLDLMMPVADGFFVLEAMRAAEQLQNIPVVIHSQVDDEESIHRALELGAYDYFVRTPDGKAFKRELVLKARNAIAAYTSFKSAKRELAEKQLAEQRLAYSRRRRQLSESFDGMLAGRISPTQFYRQLCSLVAEPKFPLRFFLLGVASSNRRSDRELKEKPAEWQALEDSLLDWFEQHSVPLSWPHDDRLVILAAGHAPAETLTGWKTGLAVEFPQLRLVLAASDPCHAAADFPLGYDHACDAFLSANHLERYQGRAVYEEIGVDRLLAPLARQNGGEAYLRGVLQPLLDYDREHGAEMIRTLEMLLFSADQNEAAKRLNIHLKTLQFRRRRIKEILGTDPDGRETGLELSTALRLLKLRA